MLKIKALAVCSALALATSVDAQGLEGVLVETYEVTPGKENGEAPLTTYRVYIDLAKGYSLQMVYGDAQHQLRVTTTTDFFNDGTNGGKFAHEVNGDHLNTYPLALDTWLTVGTASDRHMAIPRHLDTDGSILECPPYTGVATPTDAAGTKRTMPLCTSDGLQADTSVKETVNFHFASGYLQNARGNELESTNGAWAALGGATGVTEENMVLIGQFSTTGVLSFELNIQLGTPDKKIEKYVARNAAAGEILFAGLLFGDRKGAQPTH